MVSMFAVGGVTMSMRRLLGSAINLGAWEISLDNIGRTKRPPYCIPWRCSDFARLPVVAAAVLQGAMAVVAAANPVEVAAELRAKPGLMLAQWVAFVDVAGVTAVAVAAAAAVAAVAAVAAAAVAVVAAAAAAVAVMTAAAAAAAAAVVMGTAARL